jgi:hypothetical protein
MQRSKYCQNQIVGILKEADLKKALRPSEPREAVGYLVAKHEVSVSRACDVKRSHSRGMCASIALDASEASAPPCFDVLPRGSYLLLYHLRSVSETIDSRPDFVLRPQYGHAIHPTSS